MSGGVLPYQIFYRPPHLRTFYDPTTPHPHTKFWALIKILTLFSGQFRKFMFSGFSGKSVKLLRKFSDGPHKSVLLHFMKTFLKFSETFFQNGAFGAILGASAPPKPLFGPCMESPPRLRTFYGPHPLISKRSPKHSSNTLDIGFLRHWRRIENILIFYILIFYSALDMLDFFAREKGGGEAPLLGWEWTCTSRIIAEPKSYHTWIVPDVNVDKLSLR